METAVEDVPADDPAARLARLVRQLVESETRERGLAKAWAAALGVPHANTMAFVRQLGLALALPDDVDAAIEALLLAPGTKRFLLQPLPAIATFLCEAAQQALPGSATVDRRYDWWANAKKASEGWVSRLETCSDELQLVRVKKGITHGGVAELRSSLRAFVSELDAQSDMDAVVELFIRTHVAHITRALDELGSRGVDGLAEAVTRTYGDLVVRSTELRDRVASEDARWSRFWILVNRAAALVQVAGVIALPVATVELVKAVESTHARASINSADTVVPPNDASSSAPSKAADVVAEPAE